MTTRSRKWPASSPALHEAIGAITKRDWAAAEASCAKVISDSTDASDRGDALFLRAVAREASRSAGGGPDIERAIREWSTAGPTVAATHLVSLARTLAAAGERSTALRFLTAAAEVVAAAPSPGDLAIDLGVIAAGIGENAVARRTWQHATHGPSAIAGMAHVNLAQLEFDAGALSASLGHVVAALRQGGGAHGPRAVAVALDICNELAELDNLDGAAAVLDQLEDASGPTIDRGLWRPIAAAIEHDRGIASLDKGDIDTASDHLARAAQFEEPGPRRAAILVAVARIDIEAGRTATALERAREAGGYATDDDARLATASVLVAVGEAASDQRIWPTASEAFASAATLYTAAGRGELGRAFTAAAIAGRRR